jgi:DUF2892 family protein
MTTNIGPTDRVIRLVVAALAVVAAFAVGLGSVVGVILLVVAVVLAGTAYLRFCPIYAPFGMSTCPAPGKGDRS